MGSIGLHPLMAIKCRSRCACWRGWSLSRLGCDCYRGFRCYGRRGGAHGAYGAGEESGSERGDDGLLQVVRRTKLRYARWEPTRPPKRGTVCVFQGRGEYIEKYFEVVADLRRRGFAVATMDWRGQGGSSRALSNPRKGYVRSFSEFDQDLAHFMKEIVLPDCQPPYIALAHSMGGHILLRNATLPGSWFSRMVLSAPMIAIAEARLGAPRPVSRAYAEILTGIGLGSMYVRKGGDAPMELQPFEGNPLTSDRERFHRNRLVLESAPAARPRLADRRLAARRAALDRQADRPDYPFRVRGAAAAVRRRHGRHRLDAGDREFALRLKVGTHVLIPQARHEILQETDELRQRFWATFDAYLGVEAFAAA